MPRLVNDVGNHAGLYAEARLTVTQGRERNGELVERGIQAERTQSRDQVKKASASESFFAHVLVHC